MLSRNYYYKGTPILHLQIIENYPNKLFIYTENIKKQYTCKTFYQDEILLQHWIMDEDGTVAANYCMKIQHCISRIDHHSAPLHT